MDCILNPNLENCKSLETQKFGLVNGNHLETVSPHTENKISPDDQKGKEKEVDDSLRSPLLSREPKTVLPISNIRSPPAEPVLSAPLLSPVIKKFPVAVGTICTPGSGSCQDCLPGDSNSPQDPRCHQLVPTIKPIASDCSSGADPSCLESRLESAGSGDCEEGSPCEEASTECLTGECGADEENKEKFEQNKTEKCNSDICPPVPVRLSHDEEHDKRNNSSSCRPTSGDPLCRPPVAADPNPVRKKGPGGCSADSEDPGCHPGKPGTPRVRHGHGADGAHERPA